MKKINVAKTVGQSFALAIKNIPSFVGCVVLWIITIWIPYINIGTTIAICAMPIELSKGNVVNPLSIFAGKYRRKMGDFFIYQALSGFGIFACSLFLVIPGIVLSVAWSQGLYIMIEKDKNPIEALRLSNNVTYGNKWRIFFSKAFVTGIITIINSILALVILDNTSPNMVSLSMLIALVVVIICCSISVNAVIWKQIKSSEELS